MMKMSGQIRVRISKEYEQIYNDLVSELDIEHHVVFFYCFCLAASKSLKPKVINSKVDKFWSHTFTSQEWTTFYSIILELNNLNFVAVKNDTEVISKVEEFANAGMEELIGLLPENSIRKHSGKLSLAIDNKSELVKFLMYEPLNQYQNLE